MGDKGREEGQGKSPAVLTVANGLVPWIGQWLCRETEVGRTAGSASMTTMDVAMDVNSWLVL